jgi:hypothetical protein
MKPKMEVELVLVLRPWFFLQDEVVTMRVSEFPAQRTTPRPWRSHHIASSDTIEAFNGLQERGRSHTSTSEISLIPRDVLKRALKFVVFLKKFLDLLSINTRYAVIIKDTLANMLATISQRHFG